MDIMASMMLPYSWLKFIYMPLFIMCVVIRTETSNIDIFNPEESIKSLYHVLIFPVSESVVGDASLSMAIHC
jgi:hypothetical protein